MQPLALLRPSSYFAAIPDYIDTPNALSCSPAERPLRAYIHASNDLLEQLNGIESEGDEAVRGRRREVVKEVERVGEVR